MPYLIGVDVGGTNTDAVLINPSEIKGESRGVIAWNKSATTPDVTHGIQQGIAKLFDDIKDRTVGKSEIASVTIGTTHFINAVVERDTSRLSRVAVLRLCGPYSGQIPPFSDFPDALMRIIKGYTGFLNGGVRVDGQTIQEIDEEEIRRHCAEIEKLGLDSIVVGSIFSPLDNSHELRAREIILSCLPNANVVLSHTVSGLGFLERENASILNASIIKFAKSIIASFQHAVRCLDLKCPVLLTQNDGTVLSAGEAMATPIRTFSSGATNSMRGAAFLCSGDPDIQGKSVVVVDIGGTTTDVGLLLPNGFPRQSSSYSVIGGVRMNFSMPHVESIGLGGGSIVRDSNNHITVGPDSVGANIVREGRVFGGDVTTSTDLVVADYASRGPEYSHLLVGDASLVSGSFSGDYISSVQKIIKTMVENVIDRVKTSSDPLPVVLVGGGSFIAPTEFNGASKVARAPYFSVANAIGAAMGKISVSINAIKNIRPGKESRQDIIDVIVQEATDATIAKGALPEKTTVADISVDTVKYVENTYEIIVRVAGDVDYDKMANMANEVPLDDIDVSSGGEVERKSAVKETEEFAHAQEVVDIETYRPHITPDNEWIISETDLDWITIGSYILGAGGGGNPYPEFLTVRNQIRDGAVIRVIRVEDLHKYTGDSEGFIMPVGYAGSPTVSSEQISGEELDIAYQLLKKHRGMEVDAVIAFEIGGGNGLRGLYMGPRLNVPCVDCDLMGRAYPTAWQIVPYIYTSNALTPCAMSDGNGSTMLLSETLNDVLTERVLRASLAELGSSAGVVNAPMTRNQIETQTVKNTISLCWRIGRAVRLAQSRSEIDLLPEKIIESLGGSTTAKEIFRGKIVDVQRTLFNGHVYGEVIIEGYFPGQIYPKKMAISFKNENIVAEIVESETNKRTTVAAVPDLISVVDAAIGEAIGTPEFRYGLMCFVLAIAPSNHWTDTPKGIEVGGPNAFDFGHLEYVPIGEYVAPVSVIDEYKSN